MGVFKGATLNSSWGVVKTVIVWGGHVLGSDSSLM